MLNAQRPSKVKDSLLQKVVEEYDGGGTDRLNIPVDKALHKRIKARAVQEDRSVAAITRRLWLAHLETDPAPPA